MKYDFAYHLIPSSYAPGNHEVLRKRRLAVKTQTALFALQNISPHLIIISDPSWSLAIYLEQFWK